MQVTEVNSNVAQILALTFGDLAMSIGKVMNFGRGARLMFVQNADVKIWDQFLCKMTAPNPTTAGRHFAQKFSTFQKVFVQSAKSIGKLHKIKISFLVILSIDLTVCTKNESSFYANRIKTALSIGKIVNLSYFILYFFCNFIKS